MTRGHSTHATISERGGVTPASALAARLGEANDPAMARDLRSILLAGNDVAHAGGLDATVEKVAIGARSLVGGCASSIFRRDPRRTGMLRLAAATGLSNDYIDRINTRNRVRIGEGPSGTAFAILRPVTIANTEAAPTFAPWSALARREGYQALVSVPLVVERDAIGVLNLYRARPARTTAREEQLLLAFAEGAAVAIRHAELIEASERQVAELRSVVSSLRAQVHEFSNRLHAIGGLLALGEVERTRALLGEVAGSFERPSGVVGECISEVSIAGFVHAQQGVAGGMGVTLELDPHSSLAALPEGMSATAVITVLGNLLSNAFDVASSLPPGRRRVELRVHQTPLRTRIVVRDAGGRLDSRDFFDRGYTTKPGHCGVGLPLVADAVDAAGGRIAADIDSRGWTRFTVDLPGPSVRGSSDA